LRRELQQELIESGVAQFAPGAETNLPCFCLGRVGDDLEQLNRQSVKFYFEDESSGLALLWLRDEVVLADALGGWPGVRPHGGKRAGPHSLDRNESISWQSRIEARPDS
jgi:hypothetical protein